MLSTATTDSPVPERIWVILPFKSCFNLCESTRGGPLPVVESLACSRPVITTAVGIVPEIVVNGENGIIIERKRSDLRDAINAMLDDEGLSESISFLHRGCC